MTLTVRLLHFVLRVRSGTEIRLFVFAGLVTSRLARFLPLGG